MASTCSSVRPSSGFSGNDSIIAAPKRGQNFPQLFFANPAEPVAVFLLPVGLPVKRFDECFGIALTVYPRFALLKCLGLRMLRASISALPAVAVRFYVQVRGFDALQPLPLPGNPG